jgi:hypothetical protein
MLSFQAIVVNEVVAIVLAVVLLKIRAEKAFEEDGVQLIKEEEERKTEAKPEIYVQEERVSPIPIRQKWRIS